MTTITTRPATAEVWDDVVAAMTGGGDGGSCWCQWFRATSAEWSASKTGERRAALEHEIAAGPVRGLVAYVDGAPAGWVRIAPRIEQGRVTRSRISRTSPAPMTDPGVWAITCLQVRREHRGLGVTRALVASAVEFARASGATAVEAYPIDTAAAEVADNDLFHGAASTFFADGFTEGRETEARSTRAHSLAVLSRRPATGGLASAKVRLSPGKGSVTMIHGAGHDGQT